MLLAFGAATLYFVFSQFGGLNALGFLASMVLFMLIAWGGYVFTVDLWFWDNPSPCAAFVERLPGGTEFCTPRQTGAEQWDPPLWHFGN